MALTQMGAGLLTDESGYWVARWMHGHEVVDKSSHLLDRARHGVRAPSARQGLQSLRGTCMVHIRGFGGGQTTGVSA